MTIKFSRTLSKFISLLLIIAVSFSALFVFSSCGDGNDILEPGESENSLLADFTEGESDKFYCMDNFSNGGIFNCTWYKENVEYNSGVMKLRFDYDDGDINKYSSAEVRSKDFYGYGNYTVCMKPMNKSGMISSFFTYTDWRDGGNPHDEIDIEFLGHDMTIVQFNYYTRGKGKHEFIYNLGFDASEDFHVYGFDWRKDKILWYVDGEVVHVSDENIPTTPARIMMNLWNPTWDKSYEWVGRFSKTAGIPGASEYKWINFSV